MIGYLQGILLRSTPERVLLDVQGVGYEVHIPLSTYYELERADRQGRVGLHIHTHLREDGIALFGFWTELERLLFEKLIQISGIGPRLARSILSGSAPAELVAAIRRGDVARLSRTPGVGKKTAERIVLELRDRVHDLQAPETAPQPGQEPGGEELISALVNLGYKPALAERAVQDARQEAPEAAFHELLRLSLKRLSRA